MSQIIAVVAKGKFDPCCGTIGVRNHTDRSHMAEPPNVAYSSIHNFVSASLAPFFSSKDSNLLSGLHLTVIGNLITIAIDQSRCVRPDAASEQHLTKL